MAPSSRFAASSKPSVAYLDLNLSALLKRPTIWSSFAYTWACRTRSWAKVRRALCDDRVEPLRHDPVRFRHLGDLLEQGAFPLLLGLCGLRLLGALLHRGTFLGRELAGLPCRRCVSRTSRLLFFAVVFSAIAKHLPASDASVPPDRQRDRRTSQRSSWMQIRVRAGLRMAQSRPVRLVGRFLDDLGVARPGGVRGPVDVLGGQVDAGERSLGHHLGDGAAFVVGEARCGGRWVQDDGRAGLVRGPDRDPVHAVFDIVAEPQGRACRDRRPGTRPDRRAAGGSGRW